MALNLEELKLAFRAEIARHQNNQDRTAELRLKMERGLQKLEKYLDATERNGKIKSRAKFGEYEEEK